jgi:hypothetical protein
MKKPKWNPSWDKGHPDALHLDPTYTDYLEAQRDYVQRLAKTLDRESKRDSKPEWDKWTDTSTVTLWEAIALSLNVEPEKLQCLKRYPLPPWLDFDECPKEFRRRLDIAKKRISELAANSENSNPIEETEVILSRLRIMSEKLKKPWKFPKDFPILLSGTEGTHVRSEVGWNDNVEIHKPPKNKGEKWTVEHRQELLKLYENGYSYKQLQELYGVRRTTVAIGLRVARERKRVQ